MWVISTGKWGAQNDLCLPKPLRLVYQVQFSIYNLKGVFTIIQSGFMITEEAKSNCNLGKNIQIHHINLKN